MKFLVTDIDAQSSTVSEILSEAVVKTYLVILATAQRVFFRRKLAKVYTKLDI